ncbi:FecCD family ABC transporter permease [Anaerosalibacter sp. Marseille-P3206]|uniref:FecCD family ABC transporter permease n=1 Tax=Anaerosalibacter sp. Marseille-P3206 TaxID=1871005 RepID=UPI00098538D3|nr:iron ABC transporter permease [Anaerosalibacter sp. Marseille-P3206]
MKNYNLSKIIRYQIAFILLMSAFVLSIILSINTGTVNISTKEIFEIILLKEHAGTIASDIIWKIRLPRIFTAAILGGALSVSGFLLQTFFRNPIAGPFVLGISSGAKMFVSFVIIAVLKHVSSVPSYVLIIAAFAGSMMSMGFVMIAAGKVNNMSMLLVVGIMISYICSAVTDFLITFAMESDIANLTVWSMGSFSGANWTDIKAISMIVFPSLIAIFMLSKPMGAYQLGEGYAKSMGINIKLFRFLLIIFSSLLSATVTAFAGPISFVGIAVPHLTKFIMNTAKPIIIIPATFLCGGVFCTFCDLIARTAFSPTELAIGTITSIFGAPIVILIMLNKNMRKA